MTVVYGEDVPSYAMVKCWKAEFCQGKRSLEDNHQLEHPSEASRITIIIIISISE